MLWESAGMVGHCGTTYCDGGQIRLGGWREGEGLGAGHKRREAVYRCSKSCEVSSLYMPFCRVWLEVHILM